MSVASSGEFGISPFLLQAISSLTSLESQPRDKLAPHTMEKPQQVKSVSHLLQGMNEPVCSLLQTSSPGNSNGDLSERDRVIHGKPEEVMLNTDVQEKLATQLAIKQGRLVAVSPQGSSSLAPAVSDISMVNVLTALASQHMKSGIKQEESEAYSYVTEASTSYASTTVSTAAEVTVHPSSNGSRDRTQPQIIIYYNNEPGTISSPNSSVVVGEMEGGKGQETVQNYRVILHPGNTSSSTITPLQEQPMQSGISDVTVTAGSSLFSDSPGSLVAAEVNGREPADAICPVCGDKISGYHYGVYTCESCKGFFKRTVQNKKAFTCHKQGDCEVNINNRKKCPACRYAKCLSIGMKLEAIRQDRTRGGRSSYNGSMPVVKPRPVSTPRKTKRVSTDSGDGDLKVGVMPAVADQGVIIPVEEEKSQGQLAAILNHSTAHGQQVMEHVMGPPVPELLTDIMNLEPLLADDNVEAEAEVEGLTEEQVFYNYLMQLTERRLYKLVRWARNLPQFGAISTDDQILLLQNCWSDLLALNVCWRSLKSGPVLNISATHSISLEQAEALGFGDVTARLLSIADSLEQLGMDSYEYVALKVLLLISPDVKGLREPGKVQEYQEKLSEALMTYTAAHHAHAPAKFGEMLLRLPELARISFLAKEILLGALPPSSTATSLLVELLKGENAAKD